MLKMVAFKALTWGHMNSYLNKLNNSSGSSYTIFLTINTVGRWMYENGSIQRSNIRTYGLVLKSAKKPHLWSFCTISLTNNTVGRWMFESGSIQHSNISTYWLVLKSAKKFHLWFSRTIFLTNNTVEPRMNKNSCIQRSNIRTYGIVLESAKSLICNLHTQYSLPIIVLGIECMKMVALNALTSGHMNSCVNQLNNCFAIFIRNILYQY